MTSVNLKKVVIFGATGTTGLATVTAAIKRGYEVTIFVRDPQKCPPDISPAAVIQGDVLNQQDVDKAVNGQDAVIVVLGTRSELGSTTVMSEGTRNIITSMGKYGVKRVSCCISSFLFWDRAKVPERFIPVTEDHERMLNVLKESDREWVAVLPPHISEEPARGNYKMVNDQPVGRLIAKDDLAEILVRCLTDEERIHHTVGIGYPQ